MMLITELMQGGDLGRKLKNDVEISRKTGWYQQGCYYALGIARCGNKPFQPCICFLPIYRCLPCGTWLLCKCTGQVRDIDFLDAKSQLSLCRA